MPKKILLFVYGTLKSGLHNHSRLKKHNPKFIGIYESVEKRILYDSTLNFPMLERPRNLKSIHDANALGCNVIGEVYEISHECLEEIDKFEDCPNLFERKTIQLIRNGELITAFCYYIVEEYSEFKKANNSLICDYKGSY